MSLDVLIERAAFAAFVNDYLPYGDRSAESEWERLAGTGYHKRWLSITRAMLVAFLDQHEEDLHQVIGRALGLAEWYGEWPLPQCLSKTALNSADQWADREVASRAVITALQAQCLAKKPETEAS